MRWRFVYEFKFTITTKYNKLNYSKKLLFALNNLLNDIYILKIIL